MNPGWGLIIIHFFFISVRPSGDGSCGRFDDRLSGVESRFNSLVGELMNMLHSPFIVPVQKLRVFATAEQWKNRVLLQSESERAGARAENVKAHRDA